MFERLIRWVRNILRAGTDGITTNIQLSGEMESAISRWARIYEGCPDWCPKGTHSLRLASSIASEFARLVTLEMAVNIEGSARAEYLGTQIEPFLERIRSYTELGCALGNMVFKPYVADNRILIDAVQGDCFLPIAFDSSFRMTDVVFVEQQIAGRQIYTRLERHKFEDGTDTITNRAFQSESNQSLGREILLTDVASWSSIAPEAKISGIEKPLFAHFKVPITNRVDRHSPLGTSVFAEAVDTLRDADEQYARLLWEYEGGELAVDVAESALRHNADGTVSVPKREERLLRGVVGASDPNFYNLFAPQLRDESYRKGLNDILKRAEFQVGLSYGTLSDPEQIEKTATEILASKQRSFSTVRDIQKSLEKAIDDLIYSMDVFASLYRLAPPGRYQVSYTWDDSLITDRDVEFAQRQQLVASGQLKPEFNLAWYFDIPVEQAREMMPESTSVFGALGV